MYFEIIKNGKTIKRGQDLLNEPVWDNELMYVPSTVLELPITYHDYFTGREEVRIFKDDKCFWGVVLAIEENKADETMEVNLEHVVQEWSYRQISVNNAIKDKTINIVYKEEESETDPTVQDQLEDIYNDTNFAYPGWELNMSDKAKGTEIDYVYSRQNKLEALNKTMELTEDLFWRVKFYPKKEIDISEFGEKKQYIFSKKPTGKTNIQIVEDPIITHEFEHVINLATVYSEKSDSGMSSMTLREVYMNPDLQEDGFPVVILRSGVNNERDYRMYEQYPKLAPNNELEYAVIDEESVALEGGHLIEGTFAFNDLAPFNTVDDEGNTQEITDEDRVKAAVTAYHAAIRKLKEARRRYSVQVRVKDVPVDLNVGDKARLLYDNSILILETCSKYLKHILSYDDWFYITRIEYDRPYTVTLEKYLRIDRDISKE